MAAWRLSNTLAASFCIEASGDTLSQGTPEYEAMVTTIHDVTLAAGLKLGGPQAWRDRDGFSFFQGPPDTTLLRMGVETSLQASETGVAPIEGAEDD